MARRSRPLRDASAAAQSLAASHIGAAASCLPPDGACDPATGPAEGESAIAATPPDTTRRPSGVRGCGAHRGSRRCQSSGAAGFIFDRLAVDVLRVDRHSVVSTRQEFAIPTAAFSVEHPELVVQELTRAQERLALESAVPASVQELVRDVASTVEHFGDDELASVDPYLIIALQRAVIAAHNALDADDPGDERRRLRVSLEQIRHALRDISESRPVAEGRPAEELARWLAEVTEVPQHRLAELIGVPDRTWQRWVSPTDPTVPTGDHARTLRLVARIANHLRHTLTGSGVVNWFGRPRQELDGASPRELLDDPDAVAKLTTLAAGVRSSSAT